MKTSTQPCRWSGFLHPRYWLLWCAFGFLWVCAQLPYRFQRVIGYTIGTLALWCAPGRRHIAATNLRLCFPELTPQARQTLLRRHFFSLGMSVVETGVAWYAPRASLARWVEYEGWAYLQEALATQRGVMIFIPHFTTMEITGAFLSLKTPVAITYRRHESPFFEAMMACQRRRHAGQAIEHGNIRGMLRAIKNGLPLWYAPDQNYGSGKHITFANFFGISAATITATSDLARLSGAHVIPLIPTRLPQGKGYKLKFLPPLTDFPSGDTQRDAERLNALIEQAVRAQPEQYLWVHRRFKTRPPQEPSVY